MKKINRLTPIYKDYLWGGNKLQSKYHKNDTDKEIVAESWELSTHPDGISRINNELLSEYLKENPQILGTKCKENDSPLLIKYIDAKGKLSIQVHPDDAYARMNEHDNGKTELWYVVEADENAYIYLGLKQTITKSEFYEAISTSTITDYLNKVSVKKGNVFLVEPGTLHSIGEGCLIAEIQKKSNVTYRAYDFNRKDQNGNLRPLHIDKALEVTNLNQSNHDGLPDEIIKQTTSTIIERLKKCDYFTVDYYAIKNKETFNVNEESFKVLMLIVGNAAVSTGEETVFLEQGESIFLSAGDYEVSVTGICEFLTVSL